MGKTRSKRLYIYLTPEEHERIAAEAQRQSMTASTFVQWVVLRKMEGEK